MQMQLNYQIFLCAWAVSCDGNYHYQLYSYENVTNLKTSGELGLVILADVLCDTQSFKSIIFSY